MSNNHTNSSGKDTVFAGVGGAVCLPSISAILRIPTLLSLVVVLAVRPISVIASDTPYELEPILYSDPVVDDPIHQLNARIESGAVRLSYDADRGYLPSVLEALGIPVVSQTLVFSKTSLQRDRISPETPRAVYFGDDVYVGWVQGGEVLEISAVDSQKGAIFYTLSQDESVVPRFRRHTHECLQCHDSSLSQGIPGHIMRSVYTDPRGQPVLTAGTFVTTSQSPLKERFGGWYVSGTHGKQVTMGNLIVRDPEHRNRPEKIDLAANGNQSDLSRYFDPSPYLVPHSDLLALQVLAHQVHVHNLITRASIHTRLALRDQVSINRALGKGDTEPLESTRSRIRSVGEPLLKSLLFADESPLSEPLTGTTSFQKEFASKGPRDSAGRSLREFDLKTRLFRYPLSFLVHSKAFESLPDAQMDFLSERMDQILSGRDESGKYKHLSESDRSELRAIITETVPRLTSRWTIERRTSSNTPKL